MKSIKIVASAALLMTTAMIGTATAQNQPAQQGGTNPGAMMGFGVMGPGMVGPGMMGPGMMGPGMMGSASGPAMCSAMAGHIDGRLAYVKAELKITDAQEALWNSYAAAARDSANTMLARCTTMMARHSGATASLPERLDQNEQLMTAHLDAMRATNKALKPLYAALSESQKQTADQLFWGPMGMM
jgi:LTXXQ motif family protein